MNTGSFQPVLTKRRLEDVAAALGKTDTNKASLREVLMVPSLSDPKAKR
jgi:hypothetical protein